MSDPISIEQEKFLAAFAFFGAVSTAAAEAKIPLPLAQHWVESDQAFGEQLEQAKLKFRERVAVEAVRRGVDGVREPVLFRGEEQYKREPETGVLLLDENFEAIPLTVTKYSDNLLRSLLFARDTGLANPVVEVSEEEEAEEEPDLLEGGVEIRLITNAPS